MNSANSPHELEAESSLESPERKEVQPTLISLHEPLSRGPSVLCWISDPEDCKLTRGYWSIPLSSVPLRSKGKRTKSAVQSTDAGSCVGATVPRPQDISLLGKERR